MILCTPYLNLAEYMHPLVKCKGGNARTQAREKKTHPVSEQISLTPVYAHGSRHLLVSLIQDSSNCIEYLHG